MARLVKKSTTGAKKAVAAEVVPDFLPNTLRICAAADEHKAIDIRAYNVQGLTLVADVFVICGAASEPQVRAIFRAVKDSMAEAGVRALHTELALKGVWSVIDYGDIIFHLFRGEARTFYDLDGLWADAPLIDWNPGPSVAKASSARKKSKPAAAKAALGKKKS